MSGRQRSARYEDKADDLHPTFFSPHLLFGHLVRYFPDELWNGVDDNRQRASQEAMRRQQAQRLQCSGNVCTVLVVFDRSASLNVRFGSLADMATTSRDVRFTPDNGHAS